MIVTENYTKVSNRYFELITEMKGSVIKIVGAYLRDRILIGSLKSGNHMPFVRREEACLFSTESCICRKCLSLLPLAEDAEVIS